jgi:hypothetical protein
LARFSNATRFSKQFGLDAKTLKAAGFFDPVLNVDTKLFIDPLLLATSSNSLVKKSSSPKLNEFFKTVIRLIKASKKIDDLPWREASKLLRFPEIKGTCLGYGSDNVSGNGMGSEIRDMLIATASEIIQLGVDDPELFLILPLISDKVGADRISDMTTNIIATDLGELTQKFANDYKLPTHSFLVKEEKFNLPKNPFVKNTPVLLIPRDILRRLPVATDWGDISDVTDKNTALRNKLNGLIGDLWSKQTKKEQKQQIRQAVLSSPQAAQDFVSYFKGLIPKGYDFDRDPEGFVRWLNYLENVQFDPLPKNVNPKAINTLEDAKNLVEEIIGQFQDLVETKGLNKEIWVNDVEHRGELAVQRLFYAVAHTFCRFFDLDISPSADSGRGPVDFKFSKGKIIKVLVELKLSDNNKLFHGYHTQLDIYKKAENADEAFFLIVDVGRLGKKLKKVEAHRKSLIKSGIKPSEIFIVDGKPKKSASKA